MSNAYGLTMKGALVLEKVATLPTWGSADEGRIVYVEADKELYMGDNTQWKKKEGAGYSSAVSSFSDNDPLAAGGIYFIDTSSNSLTGILPSAPSIGQEISIYDNTGSFNSNAFYVNGNGNDIMGSGTATLDTANSLTKLVFNGTEWVIDVGGNANAIAGGKSSTGGVGTVVNTAANATANDNEFIFVDTEGGEVTITLPNTSLAAGSAVSIYDRKGNFGVNKCIVNGNGNDILGKSTMNVKTPWSRVDFIWNALDGQWVTDYATGKLNSAINVVDVSANYNADPSDFVLADSTAGAFTVTLPVSGGLDDKSMVSVMDQTGQFGSYAVTIIPSDGTIDGDASLVLDVPGIKADLIWDEEHLQWKVDFGGSVLASTSSTQTAYQEWSIYTTNFSAVVKKKYIVDTTTSALTVTLPATAVNGEGIQFADGGDFSVNNLTVARNGNNIDGLAEDMIVDTANMSFELVYYNNNWILV